MSDVTFRTRIDTYEEPKKEEVITKGFQTTIVHEEVPYTEYQTEHGKPYLADYYKLGDTWEVFNEEVSTIEDYLKRKIETGEIANDIETIKKEIKKMEKLNNLKDEPRTTIKLGTLNSYIKFLNDVDGVKFNWRKYANAK
jgi:hypothetical protein